MNVAVPVSATTALFNELIELDPEETDRAAQIEWSARKGVAKNQADPSFRLVLIQALQHQGKAAEALDQAESAWSLRQALDRNGLIAFQQQLVGLGLYDRSAHVLQSVTLDNEHRAANAALIAFYSGDFTGLQSSSELGQAGFVAQMQAAGLDRIFSAHQAVLRKHLFTRQSNIGLRVTVNEDADAACPGIAQCFFMAATYGERSDLEAILYEELDALYEAHDLDVAQGWELMTPMLLDIRARAPFHIL